MLQEVTKLQHQSTSKDPHPCMLYFNSYQSILSWYLELAEPCPHSMILALYESQIINTLNQSTFITSHMGDGQRKI